MKSIMSKKNLLFLTHCKLSGEHTPFNKGTGRSNDENKKGQQHITGNHILLMSGSS
jgi:hypothetical protein